MTEIKRYFCFQQPLAEAWKAFVKHCHHTYKHLNCGKLPGNQCGIPLHSALSHLWGGTLLFSSSFPLWARNSSRSRRQFQSGSTADFFSLYFYLFHMMLILERSLSWTFLAFFPGSSAAHKKSALWGYCGNSDKLFLLCLSPLPPLPMAVVNSSTHCRTLVQHGNNMQQL